MSNDTSIPRRINPESPRHGAVPRPPRPADVRDEETPATGRTLSPDLREYLGMLANFVPVPEEGVNHDGRSLSDVWMPLGARELDNLGRASADDEDDPGLPLDGIVLHGNQRSAVFVGAPGTGRTSLCRYYAANLARELVSGRAVQPVPILTYGRFLAESTDQEIADAVASAAVRSAGLRADPPKARDAVRDALEYGLLFVDGVEEIANPGPDQHDSAAHTAAEWSPAQFAATIVRLEGQFPALRMVVTISEAAWFSSTCAKLPSLQAYQLRAPRQRDVEAYIRGWLHQ
ncbi:hypothetical protein ACQP2P_34035 [Dactylosporangium sp. CA-139114]|uniref:hypothetical protein n=1 Tax=Dactylosporangium sp. CA-139114 TaxID=3239931 RepID=UPI003D98DC99